MCVCVCVRVCVCDHSGLKLLPLRDTTVIPQFEIIV